MVSQKYLYLTLSNKLISFAKKKIESWTNVLKSGIAGELEIKSFFTRLYLYMVFVNCKDAQQCFAD